MLHGFMADFACDNLLTLKNQGERSVVELTTGH